MALVDDDGAKANGTERNSQPQPVPEVAEKELTQILCYFHILIVFYVLIVLFDRTVGR